MEAFIKYFDLNKLVPFVVGIDIIPQHRPRRHLKQPQGSGAD